MVDQGRFLHRIGAQLGALVDQQLHHHLEQVLVYSLDVLAHRRVVAVAFGQWHQQWVERLGNGLLVQLAQLVAGFALPLRQAGQCLAEQILEFGNIGVVALALGLGQLCELGLLQSPALTDGVNARLPLSR